MINRKLPIRVLIFVSSILAACHQESDTSIHSPKPKIDSATLTGLETAYFASGCFWCVEAIFESVRGVKEVVSGYAGGSERNPTYQQVVLGQTGHAEAVEVYYDPKVVSYATLLTVFFGSHDPTTLNRQGPDSGSKYRSAIFYKNAEELAIINSHVEKLKVHKVFKNPITTEVALLKKFYKAEDYHQNYERNNAHDPYIQAVSFPRVKRFQAKFPELLKEEN